MDLGSLASFGTASTPGFRPGFKVSAGGGAGGGGGLLDAAVSLLSAPAADPWADNVTAIEIVEAPAPAVGVCRITLGRGATAPAVAVGDALAIELGYDGTLAAAFTGSVATIADGARGRLAIALSSPAQSLAELRQNASYEQQSFGDLVKQWCGEAGVTPGSVDDGPSYPFLAVDDRRSAWEWIALLARTAGVYAWVGADGKLNATTPATTPARSFHHGEDVLRLAFSERRPLLGELTVTGEGAAGSQGSDAWSWLLTDPASVQSTAGSGAPKRLYQYGALRSLDAADAAASGIQARAQSLAAEARVTVPGSADLGVGSCFELADCPGGRGDGSYVVVAARHRYEKARGFTSMLTGVLA